ncbi:hypothetical protein BMS3Bbin01_01913 [bacterium BMS3Bbin01]|nr:hypothetical protein BMS3Bbin01_01913 [bacterium BMS3Bbin01]
MIVITFAVFTAACASIVTVGKKVLPRPKPIPVSVLVLDTAGSTISRADITIAGESVADGEEFGVLRNEFPVTVTVSAGGYYPTSLSVPEPPETPVRVRLVPVVFRGRVATASGDALSDATVRLGDLGTTTGADGTFELLPAVPGTVTVERPAWLPVEVEWDGAETPLEIALEPRIVRAIHATMWLPGRDLWGPFLDLADRTEINAVVLDIKDESGLIAHRSEVPLALDVGAVSGSYALDDAIGAIHARGLYAIGRVVSFEDPVVAKERTDLAILRGSKPYRQGSQAFLDPTDPAARRYNIDVAIEACKAGIDEIQFDYVRFPTGLTAAMSLDGDGVYVGSDGQEARLGAIGTFLAEAREALHPLGCAVSADVFAIVLSTRNDQGIGQRPEEIGAEVDALSPMIYPDHYSDGWMGYDKPADHPFAVVDRALADGTSRIGPTTIMRPWIADFNYGAASVRAEIDAVEGYGLGWMLWNAGSRHTEGALLPAEG